MGARNRPADRSWGRCYRHPARAPPTEQQRDAAEERLPRSSPDRPGTGGLRSPASGNGSTGRLAPGRSHPGSPLDLGRAVPQQHGPVTASWTLTLSAAALATVVGATVPLEPPPRPGAVAAAPRAAGTESRLPPVDGAPLRHFEAPEHEYGPGHRGTDLPVADGAVVVAPTTGTLTFAGPVAGRPVVVLQHDDGLLTSLEPVRTTLPRGSRVRPGDPVGQVARPPGYEHCPDACLHWGLRVDGDYVDPWAWLGRGGPVRLLPVER